MKKRGLFCGLIILTLILTSCSKKADTKSGSAENYVRESIVQKSDNVVKEASRVSDTANSEQKKIIMSGRLYIVEEDLAKLSEAIHNKAGEFGGYIENESAGEERLSTTIRIPSSKFQDFITYAEKSFEVKDKNTTSENITDVYVDNEARLNNLKAQEQQILAILKQANTVEDVLKVQSELYKIRGEAEALEAKKKNWDKQVEYSTLNIEATKKQVVSDNKKSIIGGSEFIKAIAQGFSNTSVSLILAIENILIFILSNIIIIAALVIGGYFGIKKYRKK